MIESYRALSFSWQVDEGPQPYQAATAALVGQTTTVNKANHANVGLQ
jgi:hypothetical protein